MLVKWARRRGYRFGFRLAMRVLQESGVLTPKDVVEIIKKDRQENPDMWR